MDIVKTGEWDGQPIWRQKTARDEFQEILWKKEVERLTNLFWEKHAKHSEDFAGLELFLEEKMK